MGNKHSSHKQKKTNYEPFYFRGNKKYMINNVCFGCGERRFTKKAIDILSNPNLTQDELKKIFPKYAIINPKVCGDPKCVLRIAGYSHLQLDDINLNECWT